MTPWDELADLLEADGRLDGVNVSATATDSVVPPAIVIRPDTPWITQDDASFPNDAEHYAAILAVTASEPNALADGTPALHAMAHAVTDIARRAGWMLGEVSAPALDESISPMVTAVVTLTYNNCSPEES